ncbi:hypothetical protein EC912_103193 [Luteibacter rhizovicinus]|uniref:Uncharacterized protein n=1 Tax=Luteibacter rhizovicinus TaxID=242606 RepID=A0A4R3YSM1_9GAMM|nr:DUF6491 family protein [Luteibacter rhizovicinus]TCV94708.1 hypothetical protein EC912_103193 [Luteibacter rhizovicinus]
MKAAVRYLCIASTFLAGVAQAQNPPPHVPLRPIGECLRTDRINDYHVINDKTVILRNGPNYFIVKTSVACPRVDLGGGIRFRTNEANKSMDAFTICGDINEAVIRRDDPPCPVASVERTDEATYTKMSKQKGVHHGNPAGPNGSVP